MPDSVAIKVGEPFSLTVPYAYSSFNSKLTNDDIALKFEVTGLARNFVKFDSENR